MQTLPSSSVGIDVSSESLDTSLGGAPSFRVKYDEGGLALLKKKLPAGCTVHLEASGGYERRVTHALRAAGFTVRVLDPLRAKRLIQALAGGGKTDALDARRLALYGPQLPAQSELSEEEEALQGLSRAVSTLREEAADLRRRAQTPGLDPEVVQAYRSLADVAIEKAKELERSLLKRAKKTEFGKRMELAKTIPGVGMMLARIASCEIPLDLSRASAAQISSFAGVAPYDDSSGKKNGPKRIGKGCVRLKAALYMPALTCVKSQPWAKELYAKLKAKGKNHRQAIVAVMRRLLTRIVAVLKRGTEWQERTNMA